MNTFAYRAGRALTNAVLSTKDAVLSASYLALGAGANACAEFSAGVQAARTTKRSESIELHAVV